MLPIFMENVFIQAMYLYITLVEPDNFKSENLYQIAFYYSIFSQGVNALKIASASAMISFSSMSRIQEFLSKENVAKSSIDLDNVSGSELVDQKSSVL